MKEIQENRPQKDMSRRNFLKGATIAGLVAGLAVPLVGCSMFDNSNPAPAAAPAAPEKAANEAQSKLPKPEQPYDVVAKGEKLREFVNKPLWSCSVYFLCSPKGNIVVDPGFYDEEMKAYLTANGGVDYILLTHGHVDHILGLDAMKNDFPKAQLYIYEVDLPLLTDANLNGSPSFGMNLIIKTTAATLKEGASKFGGYDVKVIHTPGHTAGSCMFYFPEENILFAGDTIMTDRESPTFRATGSAEDLAKTHKKFLAYGFKDDTLVYCGHFGTSTYSRIIKTNPSLVKLI